MSISRSMLRRGEEADLLRPVRPAFPCCQEGISKRLRRDAFGSTLRMDMSFFDKPEWLGMMESNGPVGERM